MSSADVPSDAPSSGPTESRSAGDRKARAPSDRATLDDGSSRDRFSLEPGQIIGDFEVVRLLGSGGYAQVYLARQRSLDRLVALKVSRADGAEGQTLARLDHPNIVPVYREQIVGDRKLLAMRYLPGQTLAQWLAQRANLAGKHWRGAELLDWLAETSETSPAHEGDTRARDFAALAFVPAVCHLVLDIARALDHAHRQGVIHRDVKPANVLIDPTGQALLMDFNVACRGSDDDQFGGTVAYMAPEHLAAFDAHLPGDRADVDERSDIYSLGVVFLELLASRYPFAEPRDSGSLPGRIRQMLASRLRGDPKLPASVTGVPASVRSILAKCLSAQREDRYPSAAALVEDLERFLRDQPLAHAPDPSLRERTVRWFRRRGSRSVAAGTLGLIVAAGSVWAAYSDLQRIDDAQAKLEWCQRLLAEGDAARACEPLREAEDALTRENRLLPASWTAGRKAPTMALLQRTAAQTAMVELARFREAVDRERSESWVRKYTNAATDPLSVFHVLDRDDWQRMPPYRLLSAAERIEVDSAIAETLLSRAYQLADQELGVPEAEARIEQMLARLPAAHRDRPIAAALRAANKDKSRSSLTIEALAAQCRDSFDWYLLGLIAAQRGAYDDALSLLGAALDQGTANDEEEFWTHMARGVSCYRTGRRAEAIAEYGICLGLRPGFAWTHYNLGLVYLQEGEYEPALEEFERASQLDRESGVTYAEWGVALFQQARFEESLARFDQAIEHGAETARVLTNRAAAKAALGDRTGARQDLQRALAIDPSYAAARENLRKLDQHAAPAT